MFQSLSGLFQKLLILIAFLSIQLLNLLPHFFCCFIFLLLQCQKQPLQAGAYISAGLKPASGKKPILLLLLPSAPKVIGHTRKCRQGRSCCLHMSVFLCFKHIFLPQLLQLLLLQLHPLSHSAYPSQPLVKPRQQKPHQADPLIKKSTLQLFIHSLRRLSLQNPLHLIVALIFAVKLQIPGKVPCNLGELHIF